MTMEKNPLEQGRLLQLKRWNTPSIYNGWEQITERDPSGTCFNIEETHDFMPEMGPMVGYAVTLVIEPGNPKHREKAAAIDDYRRYIAEQPGPKIVVVQDNDKPHVLGSWWGEVNSNIHKSLGCVGTITDGGIRDVDEMKNAGFKALARRLCVGHAHAWPIKWGCEVEVFGAKIQPGQLIHADKHGFLVIPDEDLERLYDAVTFMDEMECKTFIDAARSSAGLSQREILNRLQLAGLQFESAVKDKFGRKGEW